MLANLNLSDKWNNKTCEDWCSINKNPLEQFSGIKKSNPNLKVGVLGGMAERLKSKLLEEEKIVDLVAGPDAYKDLPSLVKEVEEGRGAVNVILSKEET